MSNQNSFSIRDCIVFKKRIGKGAFSLFIRGMIKKIKMVAVKEICLDTILKYKDSSKEKLELWKI